MKVITRAVYQMTADGLELIEEDSYEYDGPVSEAKGWKDIGSQLLDPAGGTIRYYNTGGSAGDGSWEMLVDPMNLGLSDMLGGDPQPGSGGDAGQNEYARALAAISTKLFEQTDPLRTGLIGRAENFLSGNLDVTQSPMYASLKSAIDSQFGRARDNTIARTAAGGGLTDALVDLETNRANAFTQGIGQIAEGEMNRAYGLGTGLLPIGSGGLGTAANIQSQQFALQQQQQAQQKQNAGAAIGMLMAFI